MFGNLGFDEILKAVRNGEELYVPVGGMGLGIEQAKGGKVAKAGLSDFFRVAKRRFRKQNPIAPNQADYVNWILYDRLTYAASAVVPNLDKLFVVPIGGAKTKVSTNLEQVSALPAPQWFNCTGVGFFFNPNVTPTDLNAYLFSEYMEFWVSQKVYLEGPLDNFPSGGGPLNTSVISVAAAATNINTNTTNGWPSVHNIYDVRLPAGLQLGMNAQSQQVVADGIIGITILQSQTFNIQLKADAGGATMLANNTVPFPGVGLSISGRLHGILSRGVQ
jgi:hypothetical protein